MGRGRPVSEGSGPKLTAYVFLSVLKIWIYFHLTADFPLMDGYSEAVAGLFIICL